MTDNPDMQNPSRYLVPISLVAILALSVSIVSSLRTSRTDSRIEEEFSNIAVSLTQQRDALVAVRASLASVREELTEAKHELDSLRAALEESRQESPPIPDAPSEEVAQLPSTTSVTAPYALPSILSEEARSSLSKEHKIGQLLYEVDDGYIGVSIYSGRDELPVNSETIAVYKEVARLHAMQFENKKALIDRKLAAEDYWVFPTAGESADFTRDMQFNSEERLYFKVLEQDVGFVVIDVTEHHTSDLYRISTNAEVDILTANDWITSTGASHLPVASEDH